MGVFEGKSKVFAVYEVELTFRDKIMGGIPKDPKVIQGWLRAKAGIGEERELAQFAARTMMENGHDLGVTAEQLLTMDPNELYNLMDEVAERYAEEMQTNGFKINDSGLFIEDRQIKALLKESTNILFAGERWGQTKKGPRSFVAERVFVKPGRIHLGVQKPHGVELIVGHVSGPQGKRSTLTYHEYVVKPVINFKLEVVRDELSQDQWADLWTHAQENGLGALRSQSHGRFDVTKWERTA